MTMGLLFLFLFFQACQSATFNENALTKFNVFVKTPLNKEQIQTGGRLVERHISYLAEAGFKSILSVVQFATNDSEYNGVVGSFPSSDYEVVLAEANGLQAKNIAASFTVDSAKAVSALIDELPKPLYVHCHVGYMANLFTQLHLYLENSVLAGDIYPNGLHLGYDYRNNSDVVNLVNSLTGRTDTTHPEQFEQTLANGESSYKTYYWTHRLGDNDYWYNAGQFLDTHVDAIQTAGYKTIISFRDDGEATARLPSDQPTGPIPNHEFSDGDGLYRSALEEMALTERGVKFYHLPLPADGADTWTAETYARYLPYLERARAHGPVLVHCASGYRSAALVLTYLASVQHLCSDWVNLKAQQVGFTFHNNNPSSHDLEVMNFTYTILGC